MKKLLLICIAVCLFAGPALLVHAQQQPFVTPSNGKNPNVFCTGGSCTYVPLEPIPGLPSSYGPNQGSVASFINSSFKLLIGAGALIAIIMIVLGALTYMFSDVAGNKKSAIARIRNALWAIVILVSSYLILFTINPDLVNLSFNLGTSSTPGSPTPSSVGTNTQALNNTITTGTPDSRVTQAVCGGVGACTWGQYMVYDPNANSVDAQMTRNRFIQDCETTHSDSQNVGVVYTGKVTLFPGSTVGSNGLTGAACVLK